MSVCKRLPVKTPMIRQEVTELIHTRGDLASTLSSIFQLQVYVSTEMDFLQKL